MFKEIQEVMAALRPHEMVLIRKHLRNQPETGRRLEFFELVAKGDVQSDKAAAHVLYGSEPHSAYSHLKARCYGSMLNALFPKQHLLSQDMLSRSRFDCMRQLLIAQFFLDREAYRIAQRHLFTAKSLVEQQNLYPEALLVEELVARAFSFSPGLLQQSSLNGSAEARHKAFRKGLQARKAYLEFERLTRQDNRHASDLQDSYQKLFPETGLPLLSPAVEYWQRRGKALAMEACRRPVEGLAETEALYGLLENHPSHFSLEETLAPTLQHARLALLQGEIALAEALVDSLQEKTPPRSASALAALELRFRIGFLEGRQSTLDPCLSQASEHPLMDHSPFHKGLWAYFQANRQLLVGQASQALQALDECPELLKHKSKWLIGFKLAEIYAFIQMRHYDLVEYKLNALKQLLKRQKTFAIGRAKFICRILTALVRWDFNFDRGLRYLREREALADFGTQGEDWRPLGYEILRLGDFLEREREKAMA